MVLVVALVVLGPKRLPAVARFLGQTLRSLRRASSDLRVAVREPLKELQQPLEELRADIYETVHHFERHVEQSARAGSNPETDGSDVPETEGSDAPHPSPGSHAGRLDLESGEALDAANELGEPAHDTPPPSKTDRSS